MLPNCCGRAGRQAKTQRLGAYEDAATTKIDPVRTAVEGARSFAHAKGLGDPHEGIDYHRIMTHKGLITDLGRAYDKLPEFDRKAVPHFEAMRDEVAQQYHHLTHNMGVKVHVTDHDPYKNIHELAHDVRNNHRLQVMGTHVTGGHPFFSNDENDKFRAVHDMFGHLATGRGFDRHGEEAAYQAHSRMFSEHARGAMASETRGQNGSLISNGHFGPQRIALLPHRLWHPGLAHEAKVDWEEFNLLQHAQDTRYDRAGVGSDSKGDRDHYFGLGEMRGHGIEHRVNPQEWIKHSRVPTLEDQPPESQENWRGYQLGRAHGRTGRIDNEELEREYSRSSHPDHFTQGYQDGLDDTLNSHQTVAVLANGLDDMPKGLRVTAHVSGNQIDVLHCPFCGSGAVIARSDGTIECGYCTSVFTVQVQPAYAGFPQSVDGQPYQWPGMPDPNAVMAPDTPPGTNVNPLAGGDPMAAGAPPLGDGGLLGVGGPPESSDPADMEEDDDDDDSDDDDGNPFAKSKSKDKGSDNKKSDKKPPQKKSSSLLKTASGAQLDAAEFEAHLALKYAQNPLVVAQRVKEARARGLL